MKPPAIARDRGFTLIELLVVISIIAVLAGLAIPTANIVLQKAKETQARAAVQGLVVAVKSYQTEYNRLPNPDASGAGGPPPETEIDTDSGNQMIAILLGKDETHNPRQMSFYDPPVAKNEANGLIASSDSGEGGGYEVVDPWSTPARRQYYHMVLDYDGNHSIENPIKLSGSTKFDDRFVSGEPDNVPADVLVYSDNDPRKPQKSRRPITSW